MEKVNDNSLSGYYSVVDKIESQGNGMVVVGAWFNGGSHPAPMDVVGPDDLAKVCMFGAVPKAAYNGAKYKNADNLVGYPVQWFNVSEYMDKLRETCMGKAGSDVSGNISGLLNLMALSYVIPEETTVYNVDTGDMEKLVPMIQEAERELQWLVELASGANRKTTVDGCTGVSGDEAKEPDMSKFVDGFLYYAKEVDKAAKMFDQATDKFHEWLTKAVGKATVEDVKKIMECGDPAIGEAERRLLRGIMEAKRIESVLGGSRTKVAVIGFHNN